MIDQLFVPSPKNTLRMSASRSIAIDTARRNTGLLNQAYFTGSTTLSPTLFPGGSFSPRSGGWTLFRLNQKNRLLFSGPTL